MTDKYINTTESSEEDKAQMKWAREVLHTLEHIGAMEHFLKGEHIKAIRIAEFALDEMTNEQRLNKRANFDFVENKGGLKKAEYLEKNKIINLLEYNDKVHHYADRDKENIVHGTVQTLCRVIFEAKAEDVQPADKDNMHIIYIGRKAYLAENTIMEFMKKMDIIRDALAYIENYFDTYAETVRQINACSGRCTDITEVKYFIDRIKENSRYER